MTWRVVTVMFSWNLGGIGQLMISRITLTFPGSDSSLQADD
jgi:hypothetical protein